MSKSLRILGGGYGLSVTKDLVSNRRGRVDKRRKILCSHITPADRPANNLSRKSLLPVILHYPSSSKTPHCPSCSRELSNAVPSVLLTSREPAVPTSAGAEGDTEQLAPPKKKKKSDKEKEEPLVCGHVFCKTCADSIVLPAGRCSVCEAKITKEGMVPMGKEGESFEKPQ